MIALFSDFGTVDPYVGLLKACVHRLAPALPVIDLLHTVTHYNAHAGAHLLDALARSLPDGTVFLCVVDPGVGGPRQGVVLAAGGQYFVGPDNGLMSIVAARRGEARWWACPPPATTASPTFHGRDVFAPVAAGLALDAAATVAALNRTEPEAVFDPADLPRVIHVDHYGNCWSGIRAGNLPRTTRVRVGGVTLAHAPSFCQVAKGEAFWFENSVGLLEIAVNRGHAARVLTLEPGSRVVVETATAGGQRLN